MYKSPKSVKITANAVAGGFYMNIRKFISIATVAVMSAGILASCGNKSTENKEDTQMTTTQEQIIPSEYPEAFVNDSYYSVLVDGNTVNENSGTVYRGLGVVTGNNSSRLLMDYKSENPEAYWEIMNLLFKPDYGAGLTHVKIEFGTDVNSSSGTEPSIMRSEDEEADVTRGAGFMFAADALSINPNITVDLLRWGEPKWVTDAFLVSQENGFEARYKWYKAALDSAYDTYGIKFTHLSADANEADHIDSDWIIYFADRLENETDERYDYGAIKIVASDEVGTWKIADEMMKNEALRDAVDILGEHYNTWASDNAKLLNTQFGKEIWYTEGVASTNIASLAVTSNGSGINGTNGSLDVCNRIINGYYNGKMTMYEYQPAVAAYYSGAKYFPKSLINAQTPWNGFYEADSGIWTSAHFTAFMKNGWRFIDSACFGDGKEAHAISETTNNYMTAIDTQTGDYSIVICNDSADTRCYTFTFENMEKADSPFTIWETRGPDEGEEYDANYMRNIGTYSPCEIDGKFKYSVEVKPYSIITITTLEKNLKHSVYKCNYENEILDINYTDDFEYSDDFLKQRGYAPLYTTDYGGAFEVAEVDGNKVLMQKINAQNKPTDWRFRGTPNPITSLGDDRWSDYKATIDFKLADDSTENYAMLGIRYLLAELDVNSAENGYAIRVYPNGNWEFRRFARAILKGTIEDFDSSVWHTMSVKAQGKTVWGYIDGQEVFTYTEEIGFAHSGRVSLGSGLYNNLFDNLIVEPVSNTHAVVTRLDDHDAKITYNGEWYRTVPDGYVNFNRTISRAEIVEGDTSEKSVEFDFYGSHFAIIGQTAVADLEVYIDSELFEQTKCISNVYARQCSYTADLTEAEHSVKIIVKSGKYTIDAIEYC